MATLNNADVNDWLDACPVFVSVLHLLRYAYPIQRINLDYQPSELPEQATHILGFRDQQDVVQL